jgi:hypothetical protein
MKWADAHKITPKYEGPHGFMLQICLRTFQQNFIETSLNMKKIILVFGLISGLIIVAMMLYSTNQIYKGRHFESNEILGYTTMVIAFSTIFVGIKNFRDKYNQGVISFGKAFRIGLSITLIASTLYVMVWLVEYYVFMPDFIDKYTTCAMTTAQNRGATPAELKEQAAKIASYADMYQNPIFVVLITYSEVFPIGLIVSLISALLLKRKARQQVQAA